MTPNEFFERFTAERTDERYTRSLYGVTGVTLVHDLTTDVWLGELRTAIRAGRPLLNEARHLATGLTIDAVAEQLERVMERQVATPVKEDESAASSGD